MSSDDRICFCGQVIDGKTFRELVSDKNNNLIQDEFDKIWPKLRVMGRSTPLDKHLLVSGLQVCTENGSVCPFCVDMANVVVSSVRFEAKKAENSFERKFQDQIERDAFH